jgi:hypothetical protein
MSEKDGGPAYPTEHFDEEGTRMIDRGASLRDYFAGLALNGLISSIGDEDLRGGDAEEFIQHYHAMAKDSYSYADAMLVARGPEQEQRVALQPSESCHTCLNIDVGESIDEGCWTGWQQRPEEPKKYRRRRKHR